MRQCRGRSTPIGRNHPERCPYWAMGEEAFCGYCTAVVEGRITGGSWNPSHKEVKELRREAFEILLDEWDLGAIA